MEELNSKEQTIEKTIRELFKKFDIESIKNAIDIVEETENRKFELDKEYYGQCLAEAKQKLGDKIYDCFISIGVVTGLGEVVVVKDNNGMTVWDSYDKV